MKELKDIKAFLEIGPKSLKELQKNQNGRRKRYPRYYKKMMRNIGRSMARF